jgi:hypothetical protein
VLVRNCAQQSLVRRCRDVVQNNLNATLRIQKFNSFVAMGAVRMKKDVQPPVMLPSQRACGLRRNVRRELE